MAKQIYRKSLLEKMSSPEQLDKMIVITSPGFWFGLAGGALIVIVALIWAIVGKLPVKVESSGIYVPGLGIHSVATESGGIVGEVKKEVGDSVEAGELLVSMKTDTAGLELDILKDRLASVENVTLTSEDDVATADNQELINIKIQIEGSNLEESQNSVMLNNLREKLAVLKPQVEAAKAAMEQAKADYYGSQVWDSTEEQLDYSEAQADFSQQSGLLSNAKTSVSQSRINYVFALNSLAEQCQGQVNAALQSVKEKQAAIDTALEADPTADISGLQSDLNTLTTNYNAVKAVYDDLVQAAGNVSSPNALKSDTQTAIGTAMTNLRELWNSYELSKEMEDEVKDDYDSAKEDYEDAKEDYEWSVGSGTAISAEREKAGAIYNEKSGEYNNLYSQQVNLESSILSLEGQLAAAQITGSVQQASYTEQFMATRSAKIDSLKKEIEKYETSLENTKIYAPVSGTVIDMKASVGSALAQGSEVVTIRESGDSEDIIVCYIPISQGKQVKEGMKVIVNPTTVNKQEYGHMEAEVVDVDAYVATQASMKQVLGDDVLINNLMQNGPVMGVTCKLREDEMTASGYYWSNRKGASLVIPHGTPVVADIVTEEKAPITMLIPYIKEKITMAVEPELENNGGEQ